MKKAQPILLWALAFLLTVGIAYFQRSTGPTQSVMARETILGKQVAYRLKRSAIANEPMVVKIRATDSAVKAFVHWRRYKSQDEWSQMAMHRQGPILKAEIPGQPVAGKVEYTVRVDVAGESQLLVKGQSLVARFRNKVPGFFLISHIIFMMLGILFTFRTALEVLRKGGNFYWLVNWTLGIIFIGGMILGPIVQKYAFGDFWTGFPFGTDLTDNKTLLAFIFWIFAFFMKKRRKSVVLSAAVLTLVVYFIPHSVLGSELDYKTGQMKNKYSQLQLQTEKNSIPISPTDRA
jgi:hypothetical protein